MEYVAIEKSEYEQLLGTIKKAATEIHAIAEVCNINSEWVENSELAEILGLSKRQLQGYRERGVLGFSTIGRKIYYRRTEVDKLIKNNTIKTNSMNLVFNGNLREVLGDLAKVDAGIEQIRDLCRPVLNGEHYLSGEEVCKALRITKRTLQQYRDDGLVSFVALPGKMLYKESDILALLQQNYIPAFVHENGGNLLPL